LPKIGKAPAQLGDNAVMGNGLLDHWRASYVAEISKSTKATTRALLYLKRKYI